MCQNPTPKTCPARHGACPPPISTCWTSTSRLSPGSICVATRTTARTGYAACALRRFPAGGYDVAENPDKDGRNAQPLWLSSSDDLLHVRPAHARNSTARRFDLWRIPGRKRLSLDGPGLALIADLKAQRMRLSLSGGLSDGTGYTSSVPLAPPLRGQLDAFNAQAQALEGHTPQIDPARAVSRAALLHLRALQAFDASHAGASHRDIAQALFGLEAVVLRWHEDGELRAQVRHLLRRAEAYVTRGYLALAGVSHPAATDPGDDRVR